MNRNRVGWWSFLAFAYFSFHSSTHAAENTPATVPLRIGLVGSLFRDTPESLILPMMQPFGSIMESYTGLAGKLERVADPIDLGKQLSEDRVQLGVFHGVEFAWARARYPQLRPLMIAVNQDRHLRADMIVRTDAKVAKMGDLKGKTLAVPAHSRDHCYLFLERHCPECKALVRGIVTPSNAEEALDNVFDGTTDAALVDELALECFKRRKPFRFAKLKVLEKSEVFPAAVVAYRPGTLDADTLDRFREGMTNANKAALGRQFMALWKLTGFEPVPPDYDHDLAAILRAYPPPVVKGK